MLGRGLLGQCPDACSSSRSSARFAGFLDVRAHACNRSRNLLHLLQSCEPRTTASRKHGPHVRLNDSTIGNSGLGA